MYIKQVNEGHYQLPNGQICVDWAYFRFKAYQDQIEYCKKMQEDSKALFDRDDKK